MTATNNMMKHAAEMGWQVEQDNTGQYVIYTGIPEGAPEVAQQYAHEHGYEIDSDNYGSIILYTGIHAPDVRLCSVTLKYAGNKEREVEVWLDIDSFIKDQVFDLFDAPELGLNLIDFRWSDETA